GRVGSADNDPLSLPLSPLKLPVAEPLANPGDRPHYLRMRIDPGSGDLKPTGLQQSHALFGLSRADALLRLEAGQSVESGEVVNAWRL
ncbi:MAG: hypothetical protein KDN19_17600, partial [Verrucomicrobiae bacterium]|nr:hypothetical protein [Verrucomicrobiae bacterium]